MEKWTSRIALPAALAVMFLSGGCQSPKKADTPKEALANYANSILKSDKGLFLASTTGLPAEQAAMLFEVHSTVEDFIRELEAAYGMAAVQEAGAKYIPARAADILAAEVRQDGNSASVISALPAFPRRLRKEGAHWFVDLSGTSKTVGDPRKALAFAGGLVQAIRSAKPFIGKEGYTLEKVGEKLAEGLIVALIQTEIFKGPGNSVPTVPKPVEVSLLRPSVASRPGDWSGGTQPQPIAAPGSPTAGMTARQKLAYAQSHFAADLRLVKKHPWSRVPGADVQDAAKRVFGIGGPSLSLAPNRVDFVGLSKTQVQSLVGNPSRKTSSGGDEVWTYSYKGTRLKAEMIFTHDKVVFFSGSTSAKLVTSVL